MAHAIPGCQTWAIPCQLLPSLNGTYVGHALLYTSETLGMWLCASLIRESALISSPQLEV